MTEQKKTWKTRVGAFIPQHVPNRVVAGVMGLLSVIRKTSKDKVEENRKHNTEILVEQEDSPETRKFFKPNTYIENQRQWNRVRFGKEYTMSYGGCGIFATYNALLALGEKMTGLELVELISWYERKGTAWAGALGIAPKAVSRYFRKQGYQVCMTSSRREKVINACGEAGDTVIVTAYNDGQDIFGNIHTVNVSKDAEGRYHVHNDYRTQRNDTGETTFVSHGPYETLWQAISNLSEGEAKPICVIGVKKGVK